MCGPVAGGPGCEYAPSFGPEGDVLFVRDGSIMAVDPDGDERQALTDGPSDTNPELSPDGRHLAYLREGNLFVATDGADPACVATGRALTGGPAGAREPQRRCRRDGSAGPVLFQAV